MDGKAVGRRIKEAREKRHLTQEELAARIEMCIRDRGLGLYGWWWSFFFNSSAICWTKVSAVGRPVGKVS